MAAQNRLIKQQYCGNKMKKTYIEILPSGSSLNSRRKSRVRLYRYEMSTAYWW